MNTQQLKGWLKKCLKEDSLFDYERQLLKVMIRCLPSGSEESFSHQDGLDLKNKNESLFDISDSLKENTEEFILTSKKKKLSGKKLRDFNKFWEAFAYKEGRAAAAGAWLGIPDTMTPEFMDLIIYAAERTANDRRANVTPKMAQGWITERRWENYQEQFKKRGKVGDKWDLLRGCDIGNKFMRDRYRSDWIFPGENPWTTYNPKIPQDIRDKLSCAWGWK